jgi:hypothetical protein
MAIQMPHTMPAVAQAAAALKKRKAGSRITGHLLCEAGADNYRSIASGERSHLRHIPGQVQVGSGEFGEKVLKAAGRKDRDATRTFRTRPEAVRMPTRNEGNFQGAPRKPSFSGLELNLALKDDYDLVLACMDMSRGAAEGARFAIDDGHGPSRIGCGQDRAVGGVLPFVYFA